MNKWKMVPVEPTQAMIDATNSVPEGAGYLSCVRAYRAMLDAAPAWQAEPVAWVRNLTDAHPHCVTGLQFRSAADVDAGVLYTPLYATPPSAELARLRAENERLRAAAQAVIERWDSPKWKDEAPTADVISALRAAMATFEGDRTEPCEGCDGECGEPCQPCTVAEMHAGIDRQTAALVEAGKLLQGTPLDAIYAEADRLGCRLPSGDSPEGYSITLSLKNLRTEG